MKEKIKYYFKTIRSSLKFSKYYSMNNDNKQAAELIRYTHSVEKGLSITNIKPGFGHQKQEKMMEIIKKIEKIDNEYYKEIINMALSSLCKYIEYHDNIKYSDDFIIGLKQFINDKGYKINNGYGGTVIYDSSSVKFNIEEIEKLFNTRHSIRVFSEKPVDNKVIKKAILLAQRAPSACNRQGVRTYVIDRNKAQNIIKQLSGVGGFAESLNKIIIITGKVSSYRYDEENQFIVSAGIYAGYLSLTLHLYGLGACIIQRPVIWNKKGEMLKKEFHIDEDEQIICMVGVGNINGKINVPISHRLNVDEIAKFID